MTNTNTRPTVEQALANLQAYSVWGNAHSVSLSELNGVVTYTGWIGGVLYSSRDGVTWSSVDALWRTG